jgi:ankyrin repeat protein
LESAVRNWRRVNRLLNHHYNNTLSSGTKLHIATSINSIEMVQYLVQSGEDTDKVDGHGYAAISNAAEKGNLQCIELLVTAGANINMSTSFSWTPLMVAASRGHTNVVQWLLERGASLYTTPDQEQTYPEKAGSRTALCAAAGNGSTLLVQMFIDAGADINAQDDLDGNAITEASYKGFAPVVELLLKYGADVNATGGNGSALSRASNQGHESIVELLLEHGADPNGPGDALPLASTHGYTSIVRLLVEKGAEIDKPGGYYRLNPLPPKQEGEPAARAGLKLNNNEFNSPLALASRNGHTSTVQLLIEKGAEINKPSGYNSAISHASEQGHESVVRLLIKSGADLNDSLDGRQSSALQLALNKRQTAVVQILKEAGAKVVYELSQQRFRDEREIDYDTESIRSALLGVLKVYHENG